MAQIRELRPSGKHSQRAAAEVRAWRARLNVPQRELAELLGVSQPQISQRLLGHVPFTLDELGTIAEAWGLELFELLGPPTREAAIRPLTRDNAAADFRCTPPWPEGTKPRAPSLHPAAERPSHLRAVS